MKTVLWACFCVTVTAAPTILESAGPSQDAGLVYPMEYLRGRRSHSYPYAISPCAAAAAASSAYHHGYKPVEYQYQSGQYPQGYAYLSPSYSPYQRIYRDNPFEEEQEVMSFSDAEFTDPIPRYAYPYEVAQTSNTQPASYAHSGAAYGVFPNANVGNCGVPLLFSCSPSVVKGRVVKSQQKVYTIPEGLTHQDGYRDVDMHQPDTQASNPHEMISEQLATSDGNHGAGKL